MIRVKNKMLLMMVISTIWVGGCTSKAVTQESMDLAIGVMPAVDSAPIFLAAKNGYFEALGLNMDIQLYVNAMDRQSALQSGALDGAMTDVIALVNNVQNGFDIKVTTSTDGSFPILLKKGFEENKDIKVGMMEVSVVNYLSDEFLREDYNVEKVYINEIPARLEMINQGKIDMAVLPEPLASQGEQSGLEKRTYDNKDEFSPEVMVFTGTALKDKDKAIGLFHEAYNKAVQEINTNEMAARDILIDQLKLNPEIKDTMTLPSYHEARVPSEAYIQKIMDWNEQVLGKKINIKYEDLIEGKFVK